MFDIDYEVNPALDPTPETPMTPLDGVQVYLMGLACFSTPATLVMMARLIPGMLPGVAAVLCGGALGLVLYGAFRGRFARVKALVYGAAALLGVLAASWDYIFLIIQNTGMLGAAALVGVALILAIVVCVLAKGVFSNAE